MTWNGSWLTGIEGSKKVSEIAAMVDEKYLKMVDQSAQLKSPNFQSWMSNIDLCGVQDHKFDVSQDRVFISTCINRLNFHSSLLGNEASSLDKLTDANIKIASPDTIERSHFKPRMKRCLSRIMNSPFSSRIKSLVTEIVPLDSIGIDGQQLREDGNGLSSLDYRKVVFLSMPNCSEKSEFELALNFVHELGHQALSVYQNCDRIFRSSLGSPIYSVVRGAERPAILAFHALVATAYMVELCLYSIQGNFFWGVQHQYFLERLNGLLDDLQKGVDKIIAGKFTSLGNKIILELSLLLIVASSEKEEWEKKLAS